MSNIIDLNRFKTREELEKFATVQLQKVLDLTRKVDEMQKKLEHAETLLVNSTSVLTVGSPEEEICKIEIARLYREAQKRSLEWDEVKSFDIFVKSLLAIKGKPVPENKSSDKPSDLPTSELLKLALAGPDDTSSN